MAARHNYLTTSNLVNQDVAVDSWLPGFGFRGRGLSSCGPFKGGPLKWMQGHVRVISGHVGAWM